MTITFAAIAVTAGIVMFANQSDLSAYLEIQAGENSTERTVNLMILNASAIERRFNADFGTLKHEGCAVFETKSKNDATLYAKDSYGVVSAHGWAHRSFKISGAEGFDKCKWSMTVQILDSDNYGEIISSSAKNEQFINNIKYQLATDLKADVVLEQGVAASNGYVARLLLANVGDTMVAVENLELNFLCEKGDASKISLSAKESLRKTVPSKSIVSLVFRVPNRPSAALKNCSGEMQVGIITEEDGRRAIKKLNLSHIDFERHFSMGKL